MNRFLYGALTFAFAVTVWQLIVWVTDVPKFILPGPWLVAQTLVEERALLAEHAVITTVEVLVGLIVGSLLGMATALQLMLSPWIRRLLMPILVFTQSVPVFALAPVLTLWLGYGIWSKVAMTVLIIYFPVTSAFLDGLRRTRPDLIDLTGTMNATPLRVLLLVRLPAALPALGSGLRLAAVYAPIGAVIGEWVGASRGLGYLMLLANGRAKTALLFAALAVLAVLVIALHKGTDRFAQYLSNRAGGVPMPANS